MVRQVGYYRPGQSHPRERTRGGYPRRDRRDVSYLFGPVVISGTVCWGHDTAVTETNVRDFTGDWSGTGKIVSSGDAERIELDPGEYMQTSPVMNSGAVNVTLQRDKYGSGDSGITVKYRTGATVAACQAAAWNTYSTPFSSLGYFQVRVEN